MSHCHLVVKKVNYFYSFCIFPLPLLSSLQYFRPSPCHCWVWIRGTSGSLRILSSSLAKHLVLYCWSHTFLAPSLSLSVTLFDYHVFLLSLSVDAPSQPIVQFPKSLLNLTDGSNVTSVKAYLTVPRLLSEDGSFLNTLGIMTSKSGRWDIIDVVSIWNVKVAKQNAVYTRGRAQVDFLGRLRSINIRRTMLRTFYESVVAGSG